LVWTTAVTSPLDPAPQSLDQTYRFSVDVDAVALDVVVTDRKGRFVKGLKQEDFIVLEEGVEQPLAFFTAETTPVTVMVLLDSSASVRSNQKMIQKSANRFLKGLKQGDLARVGLFHNTVIFGPRFTDNMDEHIAVIRNMRPQRSTHLYDAVVSALEKLSEVAERKALVIFTDGDDEGSKATMEEALESARRSDVSIYTVGLMGWSWSDGMDINQDLLAQLSRDTGGRSFYPKNEKEMKKSFDRVQDELHRQYRMAYFPPSKKGGDAWRKIEIKMTKRRNLTVRARLGYYGSAGSSQ
jgi:Ca-activated chloride channel family protein